MKEENPVVSIIVRTKDRPKLLKRALQSIASQTYRPIEVVLVNDGGCDLDVRELKGVLGNVSLNYVRLKKNMGRAHAGNVGIENAKREYIGFLDDDDELYPEHISTLINFLQKSGYKSVYADCNIIHEYYDTERNDYIEKDSYIFFSEDFSSELLLFRNYIPFMCLLFEGEALRNFRFDTGLDLYEDWDLLIRFSERNPLYHLKKTTSKYTRWDEQAQVTSRERFGRESYLKVLRKHWDKIQPEVLFSLYKRDADLLWRRKEDVKELLELRGALPERAQELLEFNKKMARLNKEISQLRAAVREKENRILQLEDTVKVMRETIGWKVVEKLRGLREKTLPQGTRRRRLYDLGIKSVRVINEEGFRSFFVRAGRKLSFNKRLHVLTASAPLYLMGELKRRPVDIILPVYNGYDYLVPCIESILNCTNLNFHRLLIIDDKSPDIRIKEFLDTFERKDLNIEVFYNAENLGFVKTVNKGMKFSDRDVILLNSDTFVTARWVEKLQRAAYSKPNVASVTPFSNNATLCSIPKFFENNAVPDGFTIDSFGEFIEEISLRYYPEIPSSVGFCNYIKREALRIVGYFNEKHFEEGYGEECEFCARAIIKGFIHILDDSTYIYHKGGVSFTLDVKTQKEKEHLEILGKLHPWYLPMAHKFFRENPLKPIHDYINMRISHKQSEFLKEEIIQ